MLPPGDESLREGADLSGIVGGVEESRGCGHFLADDVGQMAAPLRIAGQGHGQGDVGQLVVGDQFGQVEIAKDRRAQARVDLMEK